MGTVIGCAWMLDGATKDRVYTLSLASRNGVLSYGESIQVLTELIRWAFLEVKNEFSRVSNRLSRSVNRFVFAQRPKLVILNQFVICRIDSIIVDFGNDFQLHSSRVGGESNRFVFPQ
ncbi:hypothetical protein PIB30_010599 [Stylosanthes scabra]|uniref:Uncharacterized protein n=1 Tax=Stylosanthes scabra TaxID=79078 RepID=A0ABU6T5Z2_9FABA|nr:hypothetical protein [Stylosanthes scabra]